MVLTAAGLPAEAPPATPEGFDLWIEAGRTGKSYWRDLWSYRELFVILAWRDIAVRYKQTVAGVSWALVQPLASLVIMTVVFGRVAGLPAEGNAPYAVMVCAAVLPWQLFASALASASQSLVSSASLISKVYFPRLIVPASAVAVACVDFLVSSALLAGLMVWYRFWPTWRALTLPAFVALAVVASLGPGLLLTALIVRYRDVRFVVPFLVQIGLFVSPVAYSSAVIRARLGEGWSYVYALNPVVGVVDGVRWATLRGTDPFPWETFAISVAVAGLLLGAGLAYFRKTERLFADVI